MNNIYMIMATIITIIILSLIPLQIKRKVYKKDKWSLWYKKGENKLDAGWSYNIKNIQKTLSDRMKKENISYQKLIQEYINELPAFDMLQIKSKDNYNIIYILERAYKSLNQNKYKFKKNRGYLYLSIQFENTRIAISNIFINEENQIKILIQKIKELIKELISYGNPESNHEYEEGKERYGNKPALL